MLKRRYVYVLLFSIPILLASAIISFVVFGAAAGALWLFAFGDSPWPASANAILVASFGIAFGASSIALAYGAYAFGRKQETQPSLDVRYVFSAVGATFILLVAVVSYQWKVGNIGPKTDDALCSEYCLGKGFVGSGMPPRNAGAATCSCFDSKGSEAVKVPIQDVMPRK